MDFQQECEQRVESIAEQINALENDYEKMAEYFEDVLDIEYRIGGDCKYRSVELLVGYGGPNIVVDTADAYVKLGWGNHKAKAPISYEASDLIDEIFENDYECIKRSI